MSATKVKAEAEGKHDHVILVDASGYISVIFDTARMTFRRVIYPDY